MSVQSKKNVTNVDNQEHILVKKGLATVARRFLETKKVRLRDGKVFFPFIRILFFSKNATYFIIDPKPLWKVALDKQQKALGANWSMHSRMDQVKFGERDLLMETILLQIL